MKLIQLLGILLLLNVIVYGSDSKLVAEQVLVRFIGERAKEISFETIADDPLNPGNMVFEIVAESGNVTVKGNSAIAQCRGAYFYLKEACNSMITWGGEHVDVPKIWPDYNKRLVCPYKYTLQDNVCTFGYTTAYFQWEEWDRYLDVMALHGYNMMFAPVGSEAIWDKVWKQMGYTDKELEEYFTGPAYFPWLRMGNIYKHSGPVPKNFFPKTVELQKKIIAKMHALGINPVAPSFAGFVPPGFKSKFPDASIRKIDVWAKFKAPYTSQILHPLSPYFQKIGNAFIKEWTKQYGKASFFLADAFNEMSPPVTGETEEAKLEELALYGKTIYESITTAEPEGTWLMMGWMFLIDKDFWTEDRMEAFFSRIPNDKMMVLDLFAESQPQFSRTNNFYGKSWMYSVIPNWGGNSQLGGWLTKYGSIIPEIKQRNDVGKLVAFGYSPEGTENNEVIYELASDAMWNEQPINYSEWLKGYCAARYGLVSESLEKAWNLLCESVYNREASHLNRYQGRYDNSGYIGIRKSPVQNAKVDSALILFNENYDELHENELYTNDFIEIAAYQCGARVDSILGQLRTEVEQRNFKDGDQTLMAFEMEMKRLDNLLSGHTLFNMERWINLARSWGENKEQCDYFEADAKRLITYWGSYLSEYAAKTWSGLVADYYLPRWKAWYAAQKKGETFDSKAWEKAWVETPGN